MPSRDTYHEKHPKANAWMGESAPKAASDKPGERKMSSQIQRLADRLGVDPDELASKIPADTIRRTKYPVLEQVDAEGRRTFKPDPGVVDDAHIASIRK